MAAKAVALKLNGRPFELATESPYVTKIRALLDRSPKDELYTAGEVAKKVGVAPNTILGTFASRLPGYSAKVKGCRYFGHKSAIDALLAQMGGEL